MVEFTRLPKMGNQSSRDPPQPVLVTQGLGEGFGVLQADADAPEDTTHAMPPRLLSLHIRVP